MCKSTANSYADTHKKKIQFCQRLFTHCHVVPSEWWENFHLGWTSLWSDLTCCFITSFDVTVAAAVHWMDYNSFIVHNNRLLLACCVHASNWCFFTLNIVLPFLTGNTTTGRGRWDLQLFIHLNTTVHQHSHFHTQRYSLGNHQSLLFLFCTAAEHEC